MKRPVQFRVLWAEDNHGDRALIRHSVDLLFPFFLIQFATDGIEAFNTLSAASASGVNNVFDLIVLDMNLPQLTGSDLLRCIGAVPGLSGLPVVIFTSSSYPGDIREVMDAGASHYFVKPIQVDEFRATVWKLLGLSLNLPIMWQRCPAGAAAVR